LFEYLEKRKLWLVYIPLGVYWLILFTATSLPLNQLPSIGLSDKINHFAAFFILSVLLYLTLKFQRKNRFLFEKAFMLTLIICLIYGAIDEIHQMWIPGRYTELLDWVADGLGSIAGLLVVIFLMNKFSYRTDFTAELEV
jgi:VanZ family protein